MTQTKTFPDTEGAVRTWLKTKTEITSKVGTRVFFGYPEGTPATPLIVLARVGGAPQRSEAPVDVALLQFDCWGTGRNKAQATDVMLALVGVLESMQAGVTLDSTTRGFGSAVESSPWLPEPTSDQARYVVTAVVTAIKTA